MAGFLRFVRACPATAVISRAAGRGIWPEDMISYYVDAGLFLTPLLKNQPANVVTSCEDWLRRIATGATQACTSWLTWDEVTYIAGRIKGTPFDHTRAAEAVRKLAAFPNLRFVAVDDVVVTRASG